MKFTLLPALLQITLAGMLIQPAFPASSELRFKTDGTFKILMVSDLHFTPQPDAASVALAEKLIDLEKPDLMVVAGDAISGKSCTTPDELKRAISNVAAAPEKKKVAWAVAFGNHDQEHFPKTGLTKEEMMKLYEAYPCNVNSGWARGIHGVGNKSLLIRDAKGAKPRFVVWLIDSGDYIKIPDNNYEWIHADQVFWYYQTSLNLEKTFGCKMPGLMMFHIPLPEFREMVNSKKTIGERHEPEASSHVNGGLFAAVLDRGDVKGIFCGHDHTNNYLGMWRGVALGYDSTAGHQAYPHIKTDDAGNSRARGGRVFLIRESDPWHFKTWMRFKDSSVNWESTSESLMQDQLK